MNRMIGRLLVAAALLSTPLFSVATAQPARLVEDIYPAAAPNNGSFPQDMTPLGSVAFFTATTTSRPSVWRTDGTAAGTIPIADLRTDGLWVSGTSVFFFVGDELWRLDEASVTPTFVKRFDGCTDSAIYPDQQIVGVGETGFFTTQSESPIYARQLWKTDGTASGTQRLKQFPGGALAPVPKNLTNVDGTLFFFLDDPAAHTGDLWKSDGTDVGTVPVASFSAAGDGLVAAAGGRLFFAACDAVDCGVWASDGTGPGTVLLRTNLSILALYAWGTTALMDADDGVHGFELWSSNGTPGGTLLVKDFNPGSGNGYPGGFEAMGGAVYFSATDGTNNSGQLWRTDGTGPGTQLVTQVGSPSGFDIYGFRALGNSLFFFANSFAGRELWKSDGTGAGTGVVAEAPPGSQSGYESQSLTPLNGVVLFSADDGIHGSEPWSSDGTAAGTGPITDLNVEPTSANPYSLAAFGRSLLFSANDGVHARELWKSDGKPQGTVLVRDIVTNPGDTNGSAPQQFAVVGGVALFATSYPDGRLWKTDGTEEGTEPVLDVGQPDGLQTVGQKVYFTTWYGGLWVSDGTASGTIPIADTSVGVRPPFVELGGVLYFLGTSAGHYALFKTDGTAAGTSLVAELNSSADPNAYPSELTRSGGLLFFIADTAETGSELWKSDGTEAGTALVKDVAPWDLTDMNGIVYFRSTGQQLWRSDGTDGGTQPVTSIPPSFPWGPNVQALARVGSTLFFTATDCDHGAELWKTDGTGAGTAIVRDILAGAADSNPHELREVGGILLFVANDGVHGDELWRSDGTEEGTRLFQDVNPGPESGAIDFGASAVVGPRFFFTASDGVTGTELWSLPVALLSGIALWPTSGPAGGGTGVSISGTYQDGVTVQMGAAQATDVAVGGSSYLTANTPVLAPGSLNDVVVNDPGTGSATLTRAWFADFLDVSSINPFHDFVESIVRAGITAGCGGGNYCGTASVTRAQMAVFLLKAEHGLSFVPPSCTGLFTDVPCPGGFAVDWIEQLSLEGITGGCGGTNFCPANPVRRDQMAVFLLKTSEGSSYVPPTATGTVFTDVPAGAFAADWIEDLYSRNVTGGCLTNPLRYCPSNTNNRQQMAVFITKTFGLQ